MLRRVSGKYLSKKQESLAWPDLHSRGRGNWLTRPDLGGGAPLNHTWFSAVMGASSQPVSKKRLLSKC